MAEPPCWHRAHPHYQDFRLACRKWGAFELVWFVRWSYLVVVWDVVIV